MFENKIIVIDPNVTLIITKYNFLLFMLTVHEILEKPPNIKTKTIKDTSSHPFNTGLHSGYYI